MFSFVKLKAAFKNTIFSFRIWALIHKNHFYQVDLIEFKAYSAPTCISVSFSNLVRLFQTISITHNLVQHCSDKIENMFFSEKAPLPPNQCCSQNVRLLVKNLRQIQHLYRGVRETIWTLKKWVISWICWIFNCSLNKVCPGLWEIFKT